MSTEIFFSAAKKALNEALAFDNKQDYTNAYAKYREALEAFVLVIKYEKNEKTVEIVKKKCNEYMKRAETLQKMLQEKVAADGVDEKDGATNTEYARLARALQDAIVKDKPNVRWSDVAGLAPTKVALKEAVILPVKFPQFFSKENPPWKGILLYGPPGTGKSFLAKAVATEADSTFFSVSAADLGSKWQGESEKLVRTLFQMARLQEPSVVFIDEVDSLCSARESSTGGSETSQKVKTEFLRQMDGIGPSNESEKLLVLGATNLPWALDVAMRRRFEKRIYVPLPDKEGRKTLFKLKLGKTVNNLTDDDLEKLAVKTDGFSGADVAICVREALMSPLREYQETKVFIEDSEGFLVPDLKKSPCKDCPSDPGEKCLSCGCYRFELFEAPSDRFRAPIIESKYFYEAVKVTNASVSKNELKQFELWTKQFGQFGASA